MQTINPNKYIRQAYINGLQGIAPIWEKKVPKNATVPNKYFLISTQTRRETERKKCDYEWMCSIVIECISIQALGFGNSEPIDDLEESLISFVDSDITVAGFDVKETFFIDSIPLDTETPTNSIYRRVVTYEHWLNRLETT